MSKRTRETGNNSDNMGKGADSKSRLLFYIPGLVDGGAERVMALLASHFAVRGHDVVLAVDFMAKGNNSPPLDASVRLVELAGGHGMAMRRLARLLVEEKPQIAISAIASCNFKLAMAGLAARLKRHERAAIILTYHGFEEYKSGHMSWLGYAMLPVISRLTQQTVAVSDSLCNDLKTRWKACPAKLRRIYNPVQFPELPEEPVTAQTLAARDNIVLAVGRLVAGKRFDLLIRAFAGIAAHRASLVIVGEGPERARLQRLIADLGLSDRVQMPGFCQNPGPFYQQAKCFVMSSQKESFGLVLVEALAAGLPVVATDCGGPREILDAGRHGVLLASDPSADDLTMAMDEALMNPGAPGPRMQRAADFDMETGVRHYESLFDELTPR